MSNPTSPEEPLRWSLYFVDVLIVASHKIFQTGVRANRINMGVDVLRLVESLPGYHDGVLNGVWRIKAHHCCPANRFIVIGGRESVVCAVPDSVNS